MKKTELLAPAGGPQQFKAAVNAGADAIYLGGSLFNARIGAGNFTLEEMKEALDYGHLRGVKTYVTMNTLMDNKDIPQALKYAARLYEMGVDALIIQDFGLGKAIRDALPGFELHLSTQATVYSPEGVRAAQKMGYSRTVLSRECSLEEIRACANAGEVEIFIHGALCICYSGQCQLSRYIGGRSGNKGMCAQPCRLPYLYRDTKGRIMESPNPLSPKDLCMIDRLGDLIEAGAASFKIEGRMKSPEYVATVVSIYRKYIDQYYENGSYSVSDEDRKALLQSFNRDGFTEGYLNGDPASGLMTSGVAKNTGIYVGKTAKNSGRSIFAEAVLDEKVSMHDVVEIRSGSKVTSFKVTSLKTTPQGTVLLGDLKDPVSKGSSIYRLISSELLEKAAEIISEPKKMPVDFFLMARSDEPFRLTARDPINGVSFSLDDPDMIVQPAQTKGLTEDDIKKQLSKTGDTAYYMNEIRMILDDNVFLPVSSLNSARRQVLKGLEEAVTASYERNEVSVVRDQSTRENGDFIAHRTLFEVEDEAIILPQITKGQYDEFLRNSFNIMVSRARESNSPVVVNSIAWIGAFAEKGVKVIGGPGLNITNTKSVLALMELGMSGEFVTSPELLGKDQMDGIPLMISEHRFEPGTLRDRKGALYSVEYDGTTGKTYIFAK
jgi:putative protease